MSTSSRFEASLRTTGCYSWQKHNQTAFKRRRTARRRVHWNRRAPLKWTAHRAPPPGLWALLCSPLLSCRLRSAALLRGRVAGVVSGTTGRWGKFAAADRSAALHIFHDRWICLNAFSPEWLHVENGTNPNTQPPSHFSQSWMLRNITNQRIF